jgi:hypothetical protein
MKNADTIPPRLARQMDSVNQRGQQVAMKIHTPMNVDSRKNASSPSRQRGTEDAAHEHRLVDQFMPNWNSDDPGDDTHREVDQEQGARRAAGPTTRLGPVGLTCKIATREAARWS